MNNHRSSSRQAPPTIRAANKAPPAAAIGSSKASARRLGESRKMSLLAANLPVVLLLAVAFGGILEREFVVSAAFSPLRNFQNDNRRTVPTSSFHASVSTFLTAAVSDNNESSEMSISLSSIQEGLQEGEGSSSDKDDPFKVGAVVRPRYLDKTRTAAAATAQPSLLQSSTTTTTVATGPSTNTILAPAKCIDDENESDIVIREMRRRNTMVAILSIFLAITNYIYQFLHPLTPLQLLVDMQSHSAPITIIGKNPKPTVVDFWAPWCENCQRIAPALHELKQEFGNEINFVMINGDDPDAAPYLQALRVDAIPHLALVTADGIVQTALIGPVPKHILQEDFDAMVRNNKLSPLTYPLPHVMLDVFATSTSSLSDAADGRDADADAAAALEARRVSF